MKYRIVTQNEEYQITQMEFLFGGFEKDQKKQKLIECLAMFGYEHNGYNENQHQREELQGQPKFKGLLGPMYDGDAIRYENDRAYETLSA